MTMLFSVPFYCLYSRISTYIGTNLYLLWVRRYKCIEASQNAVTPLDVNKHRRKFLTIHFPLSSLYSFHIFNPLEFGVCITEGEDPKVIWVKRRHAYTRRAHPKACYKRPINWHIWTHFILELPSWTFHHLQVPGAPTCYRVFCY